MIFDPFSVDLPVSEIIPDVRLHLQKNNTLIVNAPPGAGKSTLLPLALLEEEWLNNKKIIMLEPRRLAAKTIALRMSSLLNEAPGLTVGYKIRFENKTSAETKIEVVTEGILTRMLQSDNALENVACVIFDEFHERSIHADIAMALCRDAQQILRPDLKIVVMSATLNMPQLTALLQAPVAVSEGRQFPVEVFYSDNDADETLLPELAARAVVNAMSRHEGDALVFLPGEAVIRKCEEILKQQSTFQIHPLYGMLPPREQFLAIMPDKSGRRKVVLATSIAETSLTIEGIRIVIDSGFTRTMKYDLRSGLSRLETIRISKDSADQRAGRAGRLSSGFCFRMWTNATQLRLQEQRVPEILEADLSSLVLEMAQWGVEDIQKLTWLTPPPRAALAQAADTLEQIGAFEKGKITPHGKEIHRLACHPRLAHMLLMAHDLHEKQLATDLAAILEERDPLPRESGIDVNLRIEALRRYRSNNSSGRSFLRIEKGALSYRKMLGIDPDNGPVDPYTTGLLLAYAYPERIASARPGNNAQFQLANGRIATAGHKDDLAHEPWLSVAHMDMRDGLGKIFLAAPLNPKDLLPMVKEQEIVTWDSRRGGIVANKELRIGNIVLQSKPLSNPSSETISAAISLVIKNEGESLLNFDDKMIQLQNRISSLKKWNPEQEWPDVSTATLLDQNSEWLMPYLKDVKRNEDLKKISLADALFHSFSWEQQQLLDLLAPSKIEVPSGSNIMLEYFANGAIPVLAVRLQEVFGMADTPRINNGKMAVVMHLLSPGYKPVQVTSDLKSFWNNLYFEIRKELKRRYPKHAWPDDPWTAPAVAKGRSHKK